MSEQQTQIIVREKLSEGGECLTVGPDQHLTYIYFTRTDGEVDSRLEFQLQGSGARLMILGINIGSAGHSRVTIRTVHRGENTVSRVLIRSVLAGRAVSEVRGLVKTELSATDAEGGFDHHSLLLSDRVRLTTAPTLEIQNDQVQITHAATVGGLDREALIYLKSRGLSHRSAQELLVRGFAGADLPALETLAVRSQVKKMIEDKITSVL